MGREIERKFLVEGPEWQALAAESTHIRQGYLCRQAGRIVRVRLTDSSAFLTIKGPSNGMSQAEFEYQIPQEDAKEMLATLVEGFTIDKRRHYVTVDKHVWEVDVFEGENSGLVVAEVELAAEDESFTVPAWAGREVTDEGGYRNAALSQTPFSHWKR